jgi:hypothetical protein
VVLFWSCLFGVLEASCTWMCISFLRFGNFSLIILLNILPTLLAYIDFPSTVCMICRYGHLIELQSSCIFLSQLFNLLSKYSFFLVSIYFDLSAEIPSSTYSSLLEWLSTIFFIWLKKLFISRISVWLFFLRFSIS